MRKDYVPAVEERAGPAFTSYASVAEGRLELKPTFTLSVNADAAKTKELIESRGELSNSQFDEGQSQLGTDRLIAG